MVSSLTLIEASVASGRDLDRSVSTLSVGGSPPTVEPSASTLSTTSLVFSNMMAFAIDESDARSALTSGKASVTTAAISPSTSRIWAWY